MQKALSLLLVVSALALGGCATTRPSMSFVAPEVTASDAQSMAGDAVKYLADPLPPAHTTLLLDPPNGTAAPLTAAMMEQLRARGYGIAVVSERGPAPTGQGTALRYLASPLENGIVLRLQYQGQEATKMYPRTADGRLVTSGPFTLRGIGQ